MTILPLMMASATGNGGLVLDWSWVSTVVKLIARISLTWMLAGDGDALLRPERSWMFMYIYREAST